MIREIKVRSKICKSCGREHYLSSNPRPFTCDVCYYGMKEIKDEEK